MDTNNQQLTKSQLIEVKSRCVRERLIGCWITLSEYERLTGMSRTWIRDRAKMGMIETKIFEDNSVTYYKAKL